MSTGRSGALGVCWVVVAGCAGVATAAFAGAVFAGVALLVGAATVLTVAVSITFAGVFGADVFAAVVLVAGVLGEAAFGAGAFALTGVVLTGDLAFGAALAVVFGGDFVADFAVFEIVLCLASVLVTWLFFVAGLDVWAILTAALVVRGFAALDLATLDLETLDLAVVRLAVVLVATAFDARADDAAALVVVLARPIAALAAAVFRPATADFTVRAGAFDLACDAEAFIGVRADRDLAVWPAVADFRDVVLPGDAFAVRVLAAFVPRDAADLMVSVRAVLAFAAFGLDGMGVHTPWLARVGDGPTTHEPKAKHAFVRMQGEAPDDRTTANRGASDESDRVDGVMAQRHPAKCLAAST